MNKYEFDPFIRSFQVVHIDLADYFEKLSVFMHQYFTINSNSFRLYWACVVERSDSDLQFAEKGKLS